MNQRTIRNAGLAFSLFVTSIALACSSSPPNATSVAGAQEIRADADEIPCEPRRVLQTVCQQCHSLPPQRGAPFPLVRRSDLLVVRWGAVVRELMIEEIDARRMPLSPVTITDEDRTTLLGWLHAGAPATTPQDCTEAAASDAAADSSPDAVTTDGGPLTDPDATDAADAWSTDVDASDDGASIADAGIE